MKIAVIGAGAVGMHYARKWSAAGHSLTLAYTRDLAGLTARATEIGANTATPRQAVADADVVLFSVPFETITDAAEQVGTLSTQIVIDSTNPFVPDRSGVVDLAAGATASSHVAQALPQARLVKALHNLGVVQLEGSAELATFVISPDAEARKVVTGLVTQAGLVAVESDDPDVVGLTEAPGRLFAVTLDAEQARAALVAG